MKLSHHRFRNVGLLIVIAAAVGFTACGKAKPDATDDADFFAWRRAHPLTIGHDVWIGHGAIVLPGRSVATGAVIAAGAVVSRDVAPYAIVAGIPARPVKARFPDDVAARLVALAWWDWDHQRLRAALADFRALPVEGFLQKYER